MVHFRFEKEKKERKMGQKKNPQTKKKKNPQQKYIATSIRRLPVAQRKDKICNTIEMGGSFIRALNLGENICRRN